MLSEIIVDWKLTITSIDTRSFFIYFELRASNASHYVNSVHLRSVIRETSLLASVSFH